MRNIVRLLWWNYLPINRIQSKIFSLFHYYHYRNCLSSIHSIWTKVDRFNASILTAVMVSFIACFRWYDRYNRWFSTKEFVQSISYFALVGRQCQTLNQLPVFEFSNFLLGIRGLVPFWSGIFVLEWGWSKVTSPYWNL